MKITFLEPSNYSSTISQASAPFGLAYIASYLEKNIDEKFEFSIEVDENYILREKPDIVGISAYTETYPRAVAAAEKIKKELKIPVIIGGKHISALPSNLKSCFDVGVVGNGEFTTAELIQSYLEKKGFFPEELEKIQGVVFRDGDKFHFTHPRKPIRDLDILPPPKRDILHTNWPGIRERWLWPQGIYTSRGCPYKCPFCLNSKIDFIASYHSPERVISEIEFIVKNYPEQKHIVIYDELFALGKKRLRVIKDLIVSEKFHRKTSFFCMCKTNIFDDEVAFMLKEMNVRSIGFGFESGDEKTLQYLKHESAKVQDHIKAIDLCNKYGINSTGYFIVGSQKETKEALARTYWFIRENSPPLNLTGSFSLTPYPGTEVWDYAFKKGIVNPETENWSNYNYHSYQDGPVHFMNEVYDKKFFTDVFKNHFSELNKRNRSSEDFENQKSELEYYFEIYENLRRYNLRNEDKILEIGTYFLESIKYYFENDKEITKFDHWIYRSDKEKIKQYEFSEIKDEQFDVIVFNHSLEQMKEPYEKLEYFFKNHLKSGGKIILIVRNPQQLAKLISLVYGKWEYLNMGFKRYDDYYQVNIDEIGKKLQKIGTRSIDRISIRRDASNFIKGLNSLFQIIAENSNLNNLIINLETFSYIFIAEKA